MTNEYLWKETIDPLTGESSLKTHELKVVKTFCKPQEHKLKVVDMGQRLAQCSTCGQEITFNVIEWQVMPNSMLERRTNQ